MFCFRLENNDRQNAHHLELRNPTGRSVPSPDSSGSSRRTSAKVRPFEHPSGWLGHGGGVQEAGKAQEALYANLVRQTGRQHRWEKEVRRKGEHEARRPPRSSTFRTRSGMKRSTSPSSLVWLATGSSQRRQFETRQVTINWNESTALSRRRSIHFMTSPGCLSIEAFHGRHASIWLSSWGLLSQSPKAVEPITNGSYLIRFPIGSTKP